MSSEPETKPCPECDTSYYVVWDNGSIYDTLCYCPFCGNEVSDGE